MNETIEKLTALRKSRGWSRAECAKRIKDVSERALRSYEDGARQPPKIVLKVLSNFLKRNSIQN